MGHRPHILVIDPAPARDGLVRRLEAMGAACTVARGLHDAMVQCIIRNPAVIVADLTVPGSAGAECRRRLAAIPHLRAAPFVTVGPGGDLPADADAHAVAERVATLVGPLPAPAPSAPTPPAPGPEPAPERASSPPPSPEPAPPAGPSDLAAALARLRREGADATVAVRASDGRAGEVMVHGGVPFHAVTVEGLVGPDALAAMGRWPEPAVEARPAPRPETPVTLPPDASPAAGPGGTGGPPGFATEGPRKPPTAERLRDLLAELEAVGVIRQQELRESRHEDRPDAPRRDRKDAR
jgi:CheY-like chemotaxis protein